MALAGIPAWAYQGVGYSPYAADLLVSGLNTGALDPGQEYWYAYSRLDLGDPAYNSIVLSLNFEAEGIAVANRVNFQVFTFGQVEAWLKDNSGPIDSLGLGTPASADFDVNTGERLWAGPVGTDQVYYVRIFNLSPSPIQFRLTALGQKNAGFEGFMDVSGAAPAREPVIPAAMTLAGEAAPPQTSRLSIAAELPAQPTDGSPASTRWLLAAQAIQGLPPQEAAAWLMSAATVGWLPGGEAASAPAAMPVDPNPRQPLAADVDEPEDEPGMVAIVPLEPEPVNPEPDPKQGYSIYPNRPLRLLEGPNTGRLAPKSEHWYTFTPGKVDGKWIENMSLTMFFTPGEPNLARHVTFELFTGSQYPIWERGTPQDMAHFGAGSWVSRDGDYITGERLWHGTVIDGDQYFVKITNDTAKWIDYHLLPADITNTELGEAVVIKPAPAAAPAAPTGKDIGSPLTLQKNQTSGKLAAGQDIWFSFKTPPAKETETVEFFAYLMELTHKPGLGHVTNHVNLELYPFQEQHIWQRGDTDQIKPLGAGSATAYNEAGNSHTWLWQGNLVSNTIYFIRVRNDSAEEINYEFMIRRQ